MLNHFQLQEPQPWFQQHYPDPGFGLEVKEAMFEKALTPSDVGKLNRLVIPKQHAERYFPLSPGDAAGTLLGFEDESGKSWRFRYSYWNSSQSYVLTKGWSRYVKDKRLNAGDVVFFERHRADRHKLFIGWRRRGAAPLSYLQPDFPLSHPRGGGGGGLGGPDAEEEEKVTRVQPATNNNIMNYDVINPRRLVRLFGVNFECESAEESSASASSEGEGSSSSTSIIHHQHPYHRSYFNSYMGLEGYPGTGAAPSTYPHHHTMMDMEFEERQMGNRLT